MRQTLNGRIIRLMIIREANRSDIPAVAEVWQHSFPGGPAMADRVRTLETGGLHGGIETVILAQEEDGRIAGALKTTPFSQYIGGTVLPMLGLAAVGVPPWARRRGVAGEMCREALRRSRRRGDVVSALYPFRPAFYRRLGWALAGELYSYRFAPDSLPDTGDPDVRLGQAADLPLVQACYERSAAKSNGMIRRDRQLWDQHLNEKSHFYVARDAEAVAGYVIVRYGSSRTGERRPLWVRELVADDEASRGRLLCWISRQRDLWRRVRYDAAPDELFGHRLSDPRPPGYRPARWLWAETASIIRGPMFRLIDVERAITMRRVWGPAQPFDFVLECTDGQLAENNGRFHVTFNGAHASIERVAGISDSASLAGTTAVVSGDDVATMSAAESSGYTSTTRLAVDAPTLAQLYAGELSVSEAARLGHAAVTGDCRSLDAFFRPSSAFRLLDEF